MAGVYARWIAMRSPGRFTKGASVLVCVLLTAAEAQAQWTKEDTTGLTASSDWSPGTWTTSATTGTMTFGTTLSASNAANLTLGANASYGRLNFGTMNGPVTISGTRTMTLTGVSATTLDMSAASHDVTINVFLGTAQGGSIFTVGSGRTLTLGGGGNLPANPNSGSGLLRLQSSTAKVYTAGLSTSIQTGDTTNNTGGFLIGDNSTVRTTNANNGLHIGISAGGLVRVDGSGAGIDINIGNVRVGRGLNANNTGKLLLISGSIFNSTSGSGSFVVGFNNTAANTRSIFEMQGGLVDLPANSISISQGNTTNSTISSEYLMKGGTALTRGLRFGTSSTSGTGVLNMTGGTLYLGTDGIQHLGTGASAYNLILASGTLGAAANWTSSLNMRMREAFVITAADAGGTARNIELSGTLSNDGVNQGGFIKQGAGTLTLSAGNTYTGTTSVNAGTLQIGNNGTTGGLASASVITGSAGATLAFSRTDDYGGNFSNAIGGGLGVALNSGTLTLSAANTYTGTTTVNAGILALGTNGVISNQSNLLINGGGFNLAGFSDTVGTVTLTSGSIFGTGTLGGSSYALQGGTLASILGSGPITVSTGTTTLGSGGRLNSASALTISSGQLTLGGSESVASFVLSGGVLAGTGNTLTAPPLTTFRPAVFQPTSAARSVLPSQRPEPSRSSAQMVFPGTPRSPVARSPSVSMARSIQAPRSRWAMRAPRARCST